MNKFYKETSKGLLGAITWGLDTVISGIILTLPPFTSYTNLIFAPLVAVFLHDFLGAIWLLIYSTLKGEIITFLKNFKSKEAFFAVLAGLLGGPIAMSGYYLSIKYIGSSYAAAISSLYPIMGAVLAAIFLKQKLNKIGLVGLSLGVLGVILLSIGPSNSHLNIIGILFALLSVIGWGTESIIASIGMDSETLKPTEVLNIRLLTSGLVNGIVILPLIHGYRLLNNIIITNHKTLLLLIIVALIGAISLSFYYISIKAIGPVNGMVINVTYVIWSIIIGLFIGTSHLTLPRIFFILLMFTGSVLVIISKNLKFPKKQN